MSAPPAFLETYAVHMNVAGQLLGWLAIGLLVLQFNYKRESVGMFYSVWSILILALILIATGTYNRKVAPTNR